MHSITGIRGEICLAIRVDVFLDVNRYHQSSLGVRFFHSSSVPNGYVMNYLIGFVQELVMNDDPEHQWIEKIRTSRASNEARQRLFSRLSGELQRKMGLKVLNLGGNSVIGYQLHFDLEGETGVVVRGIGTAVRLKKCRPFRSPPNSPSSGLNRSLQGFSDTLGSSPCDTADSPVSLETETPNKVSIGKQYTPPYHALELGEFPFLTISQTPPGLIHHFGSIAAAKSVKLMDKNTPAGIQFRDAWWLELRTEVTQHMFSVGCNAVIGYREECAIYEDVCILSSYGTAVVLEPRYFCSASLFSSSMGRTTDVSGSTVPGEQHALFTFDPSIVETSYSVYQIRKTTLSILLIFTSRMDEAHETSPDPHGLNNLGTPVNAGSSPPLAMTAENRVTHPNTYVSSAQPATESGSTLHASWIAKKLESTQLHPCTDCAICHLPKESETSRTSLFLVSSCSRCRCCKAASVPDVILSSADFPPDFPMAGKPALIQARICRSKKDNKGEAAANELSELLPFVEYELHYRLLQKLRLRGMNALFGLKFRITVGDFRLAAIATGTGVFVPALPVPPPPRVFLNTMTTISAEERMFRMRLQKQVNDYVRHSQKLFGLDELEIHKPTVNVPFDTACTSNQISRKPSNESRPSGMDSTLDEVACTTPHWMSNDSDLSCRAVLEHEPQQIPHGTVFLEIREPEPEELQVLLRDPLQPPGLLLTTTESLPPSSLDQHPRFSSIETDEDTISPVCPTDPENETTVGVTDSSSWTVIESFTRLHETQLSGSDSFFETVASAQFVLNELGRLVSDSSEIAAGKTGGQANTGYQTATQPSLGRSTSQSGSINSGASTTPATVPSTAVRFRPDTNTCTNSLSTALREFSQLTWFRFRHLIPCYLSALDFRLTITDDDHLQIVATGMIMVSEHAAARSKSSKRIFPSSATSKSPTSSLRIQCPETKRAPDIFRSGDVDNSSADGRSGPDLGTKHLPGYETRSHVRNPMRERHTPSQTPETDRLSDSCLLTPLSVVPGTQVESYLGNLDFFFIRETTDLREMDGICGFLHTSLTEVQAVVGAHTASLGGNALLSYHLSEVMILRPTSRNQAQCLLNVCGDMARISPWRCQKSAV
ncbi:C2 domain-containing protein 5 [Fasciola gigantica]|uniref:C2 domain-containing protein 5 n=1 Tax=Fasciola gigantica TaxID=46835 RepID=A0A504YUD7_FASGI|nr:C2 domain-containing protein 5 [Fasciola gigantica]